MKSNWIQWVLGLVVMVLAACLAILWQEVGAAIELGHQNDKAVVGLAAGIGGRIDVLCERTVSIQLSVARVERLVETLDSKFASHIEEKVRVSKN